MNIEQPIKVLKKRGPKQKKIQSLIETASSSQGISSETPELFKHKQIINEENENKETITTQEDNVKQIKRRGRKPKGGKVVVINPVNTEEVKTKPNIILHLKCSINDINNFELEKNNVVPYNIFKNNSVTYENLNDTEEIQQDDNFYLLKNKKVNEDDNNTNKNSDFNKELTKKIKQLEFKLHTNADVDKKSACFWCTYDFDNNAVYIPKYYLDDTYNVYGCFCSPECSCAYLMNENIDISTKFERLQMLNHIYSKVYGYKKNIKPAPNPYYLLDKYYGNLNIQEYRSLLENERLFLVVDKPLTKVMFELIEDNDEYIINKKIIPNNNYKIKKVNTKKSLNKNEILNENFS